MSAERPWTAYRTRFVVHARQLAGSLVFTDALGREHSGKPGDYLVESSDGMRRITPRHLFEDIYVPLNASSGAPLSDQCSAPISPSPWVQTATAHAKGGLVRSS